MRRNCATNYGNTTAVRIPRLHKVRHLMLKRPFKSLIARIAIVALALSLVVPFVPAAFAQDTSIDYAENGVGPVATFSADDQDDDPVEWSLNGDDKDLFTITGGALAFKKSPDYEDPKSKSTGTLADRNVYNVTLKAAGGEHEVVVTVTNVDEVGKVTLNKPQPQVGRGLEATLKDPDGGETDQKWRWARSSDGETWTDIAGATSQSRSPTTDDAGMYLRASVTYEDSFGAGKTAYAMTTNMVEAKTVANAAPSFKDQDDNDPADSATTPAGIQINRTVDENAAAGSSIGKPVSASDADNDILFYELSGADADRFDIDRSSGQIKVKQKLDFEAAASTTDAPTNNCAVQNACVVIVTATDPSGATNPDDGVDPETDGQLVKIAIKDVNEAPEFGTAAATTLRVEEKQEAVILTGASGTDPLSTTAYEADDEDATETAVTYTVEGADQKYFNEAPGGNLAFLTDDDHTPDYEKKSSYSITIVATSGDDERLRRSKLDVTVNVTNAEDDGTVELSQREPRVGRAVIATVDDEDGGAAITAWKWYRNATASTTGDALDGVDPAADGTGGTLCADSPDALCRIKDAASASYTPVEADAGDTLTARATYTDNVVTDGDDDDNLDDPVSIHKTSERPVQADTAENAAPKFPDQDPNTLGDQSDTATRSVAENTEEGQPIGAPVNANDTDLLLFTIGGADADSFTVDNNGQLKTKAKLDYETKNTYMVVLTATDPSGATDAIMVTINVTDVNDEATITGSSSIDYAENGVGPVATFSADDQDDDPVEWSLNGDDKDLFTITGGALAFKKSPDYEDPKSKSTGTLADRNVYNVTLKAAGGEHEVVVTVTNVDEVGKVTLNKPQPQVGRGLEATLKDPDGGETDQKWRWARSSDGETWTDIAGATSQSRSPTTDDAGMYLRASVTYEDSFGAGKTAYAMTTNMVEAKTVANAAPSFKDQDDNDPADSATTPAGIQINRTVDENAAAGSSIGKPVSASDADNDILFYELSGADADRFDIDRSSGQIKVKQKLDFEAAASTTDAPTNNCAVQNACVVIVTATDPSGATNPDDGVDPETDGQLVKIAIKDVNEAPEFGTAAATTLRVEEKQEAVILTGASGTDPLSTTAYEADDEDATETAVTYTVEGADQKYFNEAPGGNLAFLTDDDHTPDYEKKSSYSITIVATSGDDERLRRSKLDVTVNVTNAEDDGTVELSQREPRVGRAVIATVDDEDGGAAITAWKWYRNATASTTGDALDGVDPAADGTGGTLCADSPDALCRIKDAASASYTPVEADAGDTLTARATYTDNVVTDGDDDDNLDDPVSIHKTSERPVQADTAENAAPKFPDQDPNTLGDQSDTATRSVAENTEEGQPIGAPVNANDTDLLLFTIGGADADSFTVDNNGQLKTKAKLDYETKNTYMVVLTATDPSGATDAIMVTINVTDVNDEATIALVPDEPVEPEPENTAPAFDSETATLSVAENAEAGANVGEPVAAIDPDEGEEITYSLDDSSVFEVWPNGQITVAEGANLDYESDTTSYTVTLTATDAAGESASIEITINVTNVGHSNAYDTDDSGGISKDEAVKAVQDFFAETITRGEAIAVIQIYFAG